MIVRQNHELCSTVLTFTMKYKLYVATVPCLTQSHWSIQSRSQCICLTRGAAIFRSVCGERIISYSNVIHVSASRSVTGLICWCLESYIRCMPFYDPEILFSSDIARSCLSKAGEAQGRCEDGGWSTLYSNFVRNSRLIDLPSIWGSSDDLNHTSYPASNAQL